MRLIKYIFIIVLFIFSLCGCSKKNIGWGVLLWFTDNPEIPSGTVLSVQIRSGIEQVWVTEIPEAYRSGDNELAMIPLPHLEFFRTKGAAEKFAAAYSEFALLYAETMQDGLPIREKPENNARRSYRLRQGEFIKIIDRVDGVEAISTTGTPLEGNWYKVLTESGSGGYCFSLRLRIFEHSTGALGDKPVFADTSQDKDLEMVLSHIWYPESYKTMIDTGRLDLDVLEKNYSFTAGISNGRARINLENSIAEFSYRKINKTGDRSWNFDGTMLNVILRSESMLEVIWIDENQEKQTETFVTLPESVEDVVNQEKERRQTKLQSLINQGPRFSSANFGYFTLTEDGGFTWDEINSLPERVLSNPVMGTGTVDLEYRFSRDLAERYTGAMALRVNTASGNRTTIIFAYIQDSQGLRMEYIPSSMVMGRTINRRPDSPFMVYFSAEH